MKCGQKAMLHGKFGENDLSEILVTGHSGFIGRQVTEQLLKRGYNVCGVSDKNVLPEKNGLRQLKVDLLSDKARSDFFLQNHFERMIHLAWYVGPKCHCSNINIQWVSASLDILRLFAQTGGKVFQSNGTVSEYDFSYGYLKETTPLENPSLHGICKKSFFQIAQSFCDQNNISFKWARVFNLYGPYERSSRLMPSVLHSMLAGEDVKVSDCMKIQDYSHVFDTAAAIVSFFESDVTGAVNICSGLPVRLKTIVEKMRELTGFKGQVLYGALPANFEDTFVVGDNTRLTKEVGYKHQYDLETGLKQIITWGKEHV